MQCQIYFVLNLIISNLTIICLKWLVVRRNMSAKRTFLLRFLRYITYLSIFPKKHFFFLRVKYCTAANGTFLLRRRTILSANGSWKRTRPSSSLGRTTTSSRSTKTSRWSSWPGATGPWTTKTTDGAGSTWYCKIETSSL